MNLQELLARTQEGRVATLTLVLLEGGFYLLEIGGTDGSRQWLGDAAGAVHLRSVEHARDLLRELPDLPLRLLHACADDEMCGLEQDRRESLCVPVSLRSAW
ncbi:DUF6482 family protein [Stutzerimonas stutzeri]|uniref:DUF6482 family protein n=1 Tax=Stutzerimonas sp. S1 TaxID=3030652 RepID=UPI0022258B36|nr:DUF6482 family protein [Stutzerimonas sp. S1]MCW3147107.1 DUF6482 family protein [Stutzerimonas sp. S1]